MKGIVRTVNNKIVWMEKGFDIVHWYGYHIHVFNLHSVGYGFSKNKFTAYRLAIKDLNKPT